MSQKLWAAGLCLAAGCAAQSMSGMRMNAAGMYLMDEASGTSMNPRSWSMSMRMLHLRSWSLMLMGQGFLADTQQSGPRGADKLYSTNWWMASAIHGLGRGSIEVQTMLSLEPATVTGRRYPELFQTGETAYGVPIVDGQHPHNAIMALGIQYARPIVPGTMLSVYVAPVGDPALGPVAFPHRASAFELPQAPLGHHWEDSTHIADDVVTVALRRNWLRLEASGFHGQEPGENRWIIQQGGIDSWSGRVSIFPTRDWMAQVSAGRLAHPERQAPGDVVRTTASVHYTREGWSSSAIWGRNHDTFTQRDTDAFLLETLAPVGRGNFVTGRAEWVDKDELFGNEGPAYRIGAYTAGFTHDLGTAFGLFETGIGANLTAYSVPAALRTAYGARPLAVNVYLRVRLRSAAAARAAAVKDQVAGSGTVVSLPSPFHATAPAPPNTRP